jgi:HPt (histidine-containing phosphotransfer) domain-containing protein
MREFMSGGADPSRWDALHTYGETSVSTLAGIDPEVFNEIYESVGEQVSTVASLYDTFINNALRLIAALKASESDAAREKTLHTLKGSAAMMGAARIARLAGDLQQTCATMPAETLRDFIDQLDAEVDLMRRAVEAQLAALGQGRPHD